MSKWVQFNLVIFLMIVVLVIFMQLTGNAEPRPALTPSPTAIPESSEPATESAQTSMVLGSATEPGSQQAKTQLTPYQSNSLPFTAMVPAGWYINRDRLTNYDPEKQADGNANITQATECVFTRLTSLPAAAQILEQKTLTEDDLPTVEYIRYTTSLSSDTPVSPTEVFILKDEQNTPQIQLNCLKNNGAPQQLYSILNAIRFVTP